jgi:hypothetical protein
MMLDNTNSPPKWLPTTHVRFNYADFGIEQAIGAIKARVQEAGGTIAPPTALKRAELSRQETEYFKERKLLRSPYGHEKVRSGTVELFAKVEATCTEIDGSGGASIQFASDSHQCHLRNRASLLATLSASPESKLVVREFDKRLRMGRENVLFYPDGEPKMLSETTFLPDMNRGREHGWCDEQQQSRFLSSDVLAEKIVSRFIDLNARSERGEFTPEVW